MTILEKLAQKGHLIADGGMGTMLQSRGLTAGEIPEIWNITHPDVISSVHASYFAAGSDYVITNTFGANPAKYEGSIPLQEIIPAAIKNARCVAPKDCYVGLDIGPTGRMLRPVGDYDFEDAVNAFAAQIKYANNQTDFISIETMTDTLELKAAVIAAKENSTLPIFATVALDENGKLLTGADVETVATILEGLGVSAIGLNCGLGPDKMLPFLRQLAQTTALPIIVKPNAGLPITENGKTIFKVGPAEFATHVQALANAGARILGGCCGTTDSHIRAISNITPQIPPPPAPRTTVTSGTHTIEISLRDTIVIGERINPTGKKKLKEAITSGDTSYILREAVTETDAGAHILDVNVGIPGIDEPATLASTITAIQGVTDTPLEIDSSNPQALERALRIYNGKALVNSVNGKEESLQTILPIVAKYGGTIVALTLDENGIPNTAQERLQIAQKIINRGKKYGLKETDFVIDTLSMAISAMPEAANTALDALTLVRDTLHIPTIFGVSNVSFGLPSRPLLNAAFYTLALGRGLSAAIINPLSTEMMTTYRAYRALTAKDPKCEKWIENATQNAPTSATPISTSLSLHDAIMRGLTKDAETAAKSSNLPPLQLIDTELVPALEKVGTLFEQGKLYLPQLLASAEAAGAAFGAIRSSLPQNSTQTRGPIILATVKGDIHDIGKNIVRALLENYGFSVIDLGRDVPPETILNAAQKSHAPIVGLSALMTTTVPAMEETIKLLHASYPTCKIIVGGAVLTQEYATSISADYYSKNAMQTVRIAEMLLK